MPKYYRKTIVDAKPMTLHEYRRLQNETIASYDENQAGYYIDNGFIFWMPKAAFESTYNEMEE